LLNYKQLSTCKRSWREKDVKENWVDPNFVPQCLSIHLKTCNLRNFLGRLKGELLLARYIIGNAKVLQTMRVWCKGQPDIKRKLSCPQASATCKIIVSNVGSWWRFWMILRLLTSLNVHFILEVYVYVATLNKELMVYFWWSNSGLISEFWYRMSLIYF
jgi:hypothetical protein